MLVRQRVGIEAAKRGQVRVVESDPPFPHAHIIIVELLFRLAYLRDDGLV